MKRGVKSRVLVLGIILSFAVLVLPTFSKDTNASVGRISGVVYDKDGTTPLEGAVVTIRNVSSGSILTSPQTTENGAFLMEGVESGVYQFGIETEKGGYNANEVFAVTLEDGETAKMALTLNSYDAKTEEAVRQVYQEQRIDGESMIGRVESYNPSTRTAQVFIMKGLIQVNDRIHVLGEGTNFNQDVKSLLDLSGISIDKAFAGETAFLPVLQDVEAGDVVYIVCKRKGFVPFFLTPCGIAWIAGAAGAITYGILTVDEEKEAVSPFKK